METTMKKLFFFPAVLLFAFFSLNSISSAHCDSMEGPVIKDALKAIGNNNVNYVLKWVLPESEKEVSDAFKLSMEVRRLSPTARELSEKYFFEVLVRIHLASEGKPFTGVKPVGAHIDGNILAADKAIETGDLSPLEKLTPKAKTAELRKRFDNVMKLKNFDVNDLKAGREWVEAYVKFFHFAEGHQEDNHGARKCKGH